MLRSKFDTDRISVKIGLIFSGFGISPNMWTLLALIPAVFGFLSLYSGDILTALILFLISGFIDAIDGAVARVTGRATAMGAFLDGIIDRYVEILIYLGLLFFILPMETEFYLPNAVWLALLIFGALMPTYIRAYADHRDVVTEPEDHKKMGGLLERAERLSILYIGMLFSCYDPNFMIYFIAILAILANVTALQRLWFVVNYRKRGHA
ncbi:MAG: CDP-alcohol phosphatidyltransferase [Candidatus Altiarchaeales archaeon ex4484_43]|nr:MAG: CDP-alcohol phosphatidyltransferase [Candidatus Altiarchaeales archaeon ex4484_43]RLI89472.1 MAG: CDP-alcohol phosphatidyltransferase family protein [Candidatus Altiarchaeales archaeon]